MLREPTKSNEAIRVLVPSINKLYKDTLTVEEEVEASDSLMRFIAILTEIDRDNEKTN